MRGQGILPLYFHSDAETCRSILSALYAGGARAVEFTNRGPEALAHFSMLCRFARENMPGMSVGLGTVLDEGTAKQALGAGADFIISPGIEESLLRFYVAEKFPWIPGCLTPTEIIRVYNAGIRLIKIFPGNLVGPEYVRSIRDLFPGMNYMPTGGVKPEKENLKAWYNAGVCAVGMGSTLIDADLMKANQFSELTHRLQAAKALWSTIVAD